MSDQTSPKKDKAYAIIKTTSANEIKPAILTGYKVYDPARLRAKSTSEPPGTKFSIMEDGSLLFDKHVISFRPKVGIHVDDPSQSIQVKQHGKDMQELLDSFHSLADKDLQKYQEDHGDVNAGNVQYRKVENGLTRWSWNGSGGHVWWEVVEVDIMYDDGAAMEMR